MFCLNAISFFPMQPTSPQAALLVWDRQPDSRGVPGVCVAPGRSAPHGVQPTSCKAADPAMAVCESKIFSQKLLLLSFFRKFVFVYCVLTLCCHSNSCNCKKRVFSIETYLNRHFICVALFPEPTSNKNKFLASSTTCCGTTRLCCACTLRPSCTRATCAWCWAAQPLCGRARTAASSRSLRPAHTSCCRRRQTQTCPLCEINICLLWSFCCCCCCSGSCNYGACCWVRGSCGNVAVSHWCERGGGLF